MSYLQTDVTTILGIGLLVILIFQFITRQLYKTIGLLARRCFQCIYKKRPRRHQPRSADTSTPDIELNSLPRPRPRSGTPKLQRHTSRSYLPDLTISHPLQYRPVASSKVVYVSIRIPQNKFKKKHTSTCGQPPLPA
jgi:hypothetical protein